MVYCTADIHGEFDRFQRMLGLIDFSEQDVLYVLGDVIDRGLDGVKVLEYIRERENIILLMGNHERMCLDALGIDFRIGARKLWEANGGAPTRMDLVKNRSREERETLLAYLKDLPLSLDIEVGGRAFRLVHGFPGETEDEMLWGRPKAGMTHRPLPGKTVIVGHTPVQYLAGSMDNEPLIWHGPGILDIDCGCGHNYPKKLLACVRLDDMKEFYV